MHTDVRGWTLADLVDDHQFQLLLSEAERVFQPFTTSTGTVVFAAPAHIVTAVKG
jgi:hypothetical protein